MDAPTMLPRPPCLLLVCGLPGVGKTTVSRHLAATFDARLLRTDVVRKELFDTPEYTTGESNQTYAALNYRARRTLTGGTPVVCDGTFRASERRDAVLSVADAVDVPAAIVHVVCDQDVVEARLAAREDDASDADITVYQQLKDEFEAIQRPHVTIDNSEGRDATCNQLAAVLPDEFELR